MSARVVWLHIIQQGLCLDPPTLQAFLEIREEVGVFAGEDGEGGEDVVEVGGVEAVGFGDGAVGVPEEGLEVAILGDVLDPYRPGELGRNAGQ